MERYKQLYDLITSIEGDFQKFYDKDNQAAGTRIRKAMQDLKKMSQDIRVEVQDKKNAREAEESAAKAPAKAATKAAPAKAAAKAPAKETKAKKK